MSFDHLQGWTPNPAGVEAFLKTLDKPLFGDAAPHLLKDEKRDTVLYKSLARLARKDYFLSAQGIGDCHDGSSTVRMADNTEKPIQDVKIGEYVISGKNQIKRVTEVFEKNYDGKMIKLHTSHVVSTNSTADHGYKVMVEGKLIWKSAEEIEAGDRLLLPFGLDAPCEKSECEYGLLYSVMSKEEYDYKGKVYCIEVQDDHSFICNGYMSSNCVSWGWGHGVDALLGIMYDLGLTGEWKEAATEAIYGGSRVEARGVRYGGWGDGSYGGAAAKFVNKWGVLYRQKYNNDDLSTYSANRAKQWGNYGVPDELEPTAKEHPVKQVTLVTTFEEAAAAIQNGYPVPVCSNQGFSSSRDKDGFARASGSWSHCMCFLGVRYGSRPGLLVQNSWGRFNDGPKWPEDQPEGSFWVEASVANRMLSGEDSFAVADAVGFPRRKIVWGDAWN